MDSMKKLGGMNAAEKIIFWIVFVGAFFLGTIAALCNVKTLLVVSFGVWAILSVAILSGAPLTPAMGAVFGTSFGLGLLGLAIAARNKGAAK